MLGSTLFSVTPELAKIGAASLGFMNGLLSAELIGLGALGLRQLLSRKTRQERMITSRLMSRNEGRAGAHAVRSHEALDFEWVGAGSNHGDELIMLCD